METTMDYTPHANTTPEPCGGKLPGEAGKQDSAAVSKLVTEHNESSGRRKLHPHVLESQLAWQKLSFNWINNKSRAQ